MRSILLAVALGLSLAVSPASGQSAPRAATAGGRTVAFWPLDDGTGTIVRDKVGGVNGVFHGVGDRVPAWQGGELLFPGGKGGGSIRVGGGGRLLSGPFFSIGFEIKPLDKSAGYTILAAKHGSVKTGGWNIGYWGAKRQLSLFVGDGKNNNKFIFITPKRLPTDRWSRIEIEYDGVHMHFTLDGKLVKSIEHPGMVMKPSRYELLMGGYYSGLARGLKGSLRNVRLAIPAPKDDLHGVVVVKDLGRPTIDGKLDDPAWRGAAFQRKFVVFTADKPAEPDTSFAVCADRDNLYMAIRCHEPNLDRIKARLRERDEFSGDDSIEVFLQPELDGHYFIQLALSAGNTQYDCLLSHHGTRVRMDFDMKWRSAVGREADAWTAELAIPLAELLVRPSQGNTWRMNVCRNVASRPPDATPKVLFTTWGSIGEGEMKSFQNVKLFRFATGIPAPKYSSVLRGRVRAKRKQWGLDDKPSTEKMGLLAIHEPWIVPNNLHAPNWFVNLAGGRDIMTRKTTYVLDLPEGIELTSVGILRREGKDGEPAINYTFRRAGTAQHDGGTYQRYVVTPVSLHRNNIVPGPFFLRSSLADDEKSDMYCFAQWKGGKQKPVKIALVTKAFPTPGPPEKLIAPIAWMFATSRETWPDFLDSYAKLGFNMVATHGLYDRILTPERIQAGLDLARQHGLRVLYVDSPFHPIMNRPETVSQLGKPKPRKQSDLCPSYRGPIYQDELKRLATKALASRPEEVTLDIECYGFGAFAGKSGQCKRCNADVQKRGKPAAEAVVDMGTEILHDVHQAITEAFTAEGLPVPAFGTYHTQPGGFVYQDLFDFDKMDKRRVARCHPVYYSSAKAKAMGVELRRLRRLTDGTQILPWLTPGYSASDYQVEYVSPWLYDRVLETYGSGIRGIYWFAFQKFEAADFYYYAKAMDSVTPVAEIVCDSKPLDDITCDKSGYSVTGIRRGSDVLLLVSNYDKPSPATLTVTVPGAMTGRVYDLARKRPAGPVDGRKVTIPFEPGVPGAHAALYYVGTKEF